MRTSLFSLTLLIVLLSAFGVLATEKPIRIVGAQGSSGSLEGANRDIFHYFSKAHQRRYGKMAVLSSSISATTLMGRRISLVEAKVEVGASKKTQWVVFSVWPHKQDVYRGVVYVFERDVNHRQYMTKHIRQILNKHN